MNWIKRLFGIKEEVISKPSDVLIRVYHANIGCNTYNHFEKNWVNADLPKQLKDVKIEFIRVDLPVFESINIISYKTGKEIKEFHPLALNELSDYLSKKLIPNLK